MAGKPNSNRHTLSARVQMARYFYQRYPRQAVLMFGGFGVAGLLETIGIVSILPLLEFLLDQDSRSPVRLVVEDAFSLLGLPATPNLILVLLILVFGLKAVTHLGLMRYISFATAKLAYDQRNEFLHLLLGARWQFFTNRSLGQFVNSALFESAKGSACFAALCQIAESFFRAIVLVVGAALISWHVSFAALLVGMILGKGLSSLIRISEQTGSATANANKELSKRLSDALQNIKPLKAMRLEGRMFGFIEKQSHILFQSYSRQLFAKYALPILREPLIVIFILGGIVGFTNLGVPFSHLMILAALFYRAVNSWGLLQQNLQTLATNESYFWSFQEILQAASNQQEPHKGAHSANFAKSVCFEKVNFNYGNKIVLKNASFQVCQNQLTALIGASGAGKTSIADLVCGLHQAQSGSILVDGTDVLELNIAEWRGLIGYVAQEFFMLNDTLRMNIAMSDPSISDEDIWRALDEAGASEFVSELPDGLDTQLGERGLMLSGGQRQRISLARALVRRPRLLILDEATTALDPETEAKICMTLQEISRRTAVLAISHQKAVVNSADRVYEVIPSNEFSADGNVRLISERNYRSTCGPGSIESLSSNGHISVSD